MVTEGGWKPEAEPRSRIAARQGGQDRSAPRATAPARRDSTCSRSAPAAASSLRCWPRRSARPAECSRSTSTTCARVTDGYEFRLVEGVELPFDEDAFDIVVSNHTIEHVGGPDAQLVHLQEIARVLRPAGVGYLASPSRWALVEPHFKVPMLSWLPVSARDRALRLSRRGRVYDISPRSRPELLDADRRGAGLRGRRRDDRRIAGRVRSRTRHRRAGRRPGARRCARSVAGRDPHDGLPPRGVTPGPRCPAARGSIACRHSSLGGRMFTSRTLAGRARWGLAARSRVPHWRWVPPGRRPHGPCRRVAANPRDRLPRHSGTAPRCRVPTRPTPPRPAPRRWPRPPPT